MGEETAFVVLQFIAQEFINVVEKERLVLVLRQGTYVVITLKYCSIRELVAPLKIPVSCSIHIILTRRVCLSEPYSGEQQCTTKILPPPPPSIP